MEKRSLLLKILSLVTLIQNSLEKKVYVYNKKTFLKTYNDPNTKDKDTIFIRKTFKTQETVLDRVEYKDFLMKFLKNFIDKIPEEAMDEAEKHHNEILDKYLGLKEEKEDYTLEDAIHDISLGNLSVFIDVGHLKEEDEDPVSDEDLKVEMYLSDNNLDHEDL